MVIALTYYPCRTDRAVLAVNGFAADGNTFVKKVKQRLEVRLVLFDTISQKGIHSFHVASGTDTTTQRICLSAQSRV
jgi:hypothetical protein